MRVPCRFLLLSAVVLLASLVQDAAGAAVMSIDLGTEWMKVSFSPTIYVSIEANQLVFA